MAIPASARPRARASKTLTVRADVRERFAAIRKRAEERAANAEVELKRAIARGAAAPKKAGGWRAKTPKPTPMPAPRDRRSR